MVILQVPLVSNHAMVRNFQERLLLETDAPDQLPCSLRGGNDVFSPNSNSFGVFSHSKGFRAKKNPSCRCCWVFLGFILSKWLWTLENWNLELIFLHRNLPGLLNNNPPQISVGNGVERDFLAAISEDSQYFTLTFSFPDRWLLSYWRGMGSWVQVAMLEGSMV